MQKLKKVSTQADRKHAIIATLCAALLLIPAVFTGVKCAQALNTGKYDEDDWFRRGHNWVILNALELLKKDGYVAEAEAIEQYLKPVIDGSCDADKGSAHHGFLYGVPVWNQYDMTNMGGTGLDGGGMAHFFDPWAHHGIGPMEDLWTAVALTSPLVVLGFPVTIGVIQSLEEWRNWCGKNAAEVAGRAFNKAVNSWNEAIEIMHSFYGGEEEYFERAMYFLGYVLHVLTDVAAVPHHARPELYDGHAEYENFVDEELKNTLPDTNLSAALAANTVYNIGDTDYPIYLEDLRRLSDGIYIAGDTDQLIDTESEVESLRKGHIYQLSNPVYQFIDFAAHESIEWYPLANDGGVPDAYGDYWDEGWIDVDDWWEIPNYLEASNLRKKQRGDEWEDNHFSRLLFHFEGVDRVVADFEGAWGHNYEAIDMENFWGTDLGWVAAFDGYEWFGPGNLGDMPNQVGGPWVNKGWLYGGPEPAASNTLQLETCVYKGLSASDIDCDGWQISELRFHDKYHWNGWQQINDPLLSVQANPPQYRDSAYNVWPLPLLDAPVEGLYQPEKFPAIHLLDLASKLCAGMIKYFFDQVPFSVATHPETEFVSRPPYVYEAKFFDYQDETGKIWYSPHSDFPGAGGQLRARQGRLVRKAGGSEEWVWETTGAGLWHINYQVDNGDWRRKTLEIGTYYAPYNVEIPDDELEHTIRYYSYNREFQDEPEKTVVFQQDKISPTVELTFGNPSRQVDGTWYITRDTPITLTASDDGGSGVEGIYYSVYSVEEEEWVLTPPWDHGAGIYAHSSRNNYAFSLGGQRYANPFNLDGDTILTFSEFYHWIYGWLPVATFEWTTLPAGTYRIYYNSQDHVYRYASYEYHPELDRPELEWPAPGRMVELELVDSIEGVGVQVAPYCLAAQPSDSVDYKVSICNWGETSQTYDLAVDGLDPTWFTFSETSVTVDSDETANVTLTVSPPYTSLIMKDYPFTVTATQQGSPEVSDTAEAILTLVFWTDPPSEPEGSLEVDVEPEPIPIGSTATASVHVVNNQNFDDLIALAINVDDILEPDQADLTWLSLGGMLIFAPAGSTTTVPLTVTVPDGSSIGCKMFDLTVKSTTWPVSAVMQRVRVTSDVTAPATEMLIAPPHYIDALDNTYVTSDTSFTLTADDGPNGTGVDATNYRYYNLTYDSDWTDYANPFYLTGLEDGPYSIDYYSTDAVGNVEPTNPREVILDNTAPEITISNPPASWALQDGVTFQGSLTDSGSGVFSMSFSIREADGGEGLPIGFEGLLAAYDAVTGAWSVFFDTLLVPDGYYVLHVEATDNLGNAASTTTPYSIRNWAVIELLPSSVNNKAGRTMPVKFALRVAASVDPTQPFVYNEELTIEIYATDNPSNILQTSTFGDTARDYRISSRHYITNFKTIKRKPTEYTVAIYRETFDIGSFTFETTR